MSWSITLGRLLGIEIRVHMTFFLLLTWLATVYWIGHGPSAAAHGTVFILLLFGCVVLHELGHALAARRYGIRTEHITLLPIGGVAALERMPEKPAREIFVALAGPLVNVVIALLLVVVAGASLDTSRLQTIANASSTDLLTKLATVNLVIAIFNLIPAFPMDGGRVLRALLAYRMPFPAATRMAAQIGQAVAFLFALLGLLGNPLLFLIALFIYLAASAESHTVDLREACRGRSAADAMITSFKSLGIDATIDDAAELILRTTQQEFPVLDATGGLKGVITRSAIIEALGSHHGGSTPVTAAMHVDMPTEAADTPLENIARHLEKQRDVIIAVKDKNANFLGYVTFENMAELLMLRRARADAP